jgi:hypothetical protein
MYVLGIVIVAGFFCVVIYKLSQSQDVQLEIGALIGSFATVVGYFFGTSKSSKDKDKTISDQLNKQ